MTERSASLPERKTGREESRPVQSAKSGQRADMT
jgi:hypothetical protein